MVTIAEVIKFLIEKGPGRTELELAEAIYGNHTCQQHVNQDCRMLADARMVERRGKGGPADPYRYFPVAQS